MDHTELILKGWQILDDLIDEKDSSRITLTGNTLTIPDIIFIARYNGRTTINPSTIYYMQESLDKLKKKLRGGNVINGADTGFRGNDNTKTNKSDNTKTNKSDKIQHDLISELHNGIFPSGKRDHQIGPLEESLRKRRYDSYINGVDEAPYLPRSWARAAILIRINSLISGRSAARPIVAERMQDLLKYDIMPMIPLRGSISASGDLSSLSYVYGAIEGKSTIRMLSEDGGHVYADEAFEHNGLKPVVLQAREALTMTNGTAVSAAVGALALHDTHGLAILAQVLTAMSVEALNGSTESFHPFFSEVRPHSGQKECARNILAFLEGSKLTKVDNWDDPTPGQDRDVIRAAPQWLGPILEDLVLAHEQILVECNSVTDNSLVTQKGRFLHGGNSQAKVVSSAVEEMRQGIQGIGRLLSSQYTELINPATNRGLPPNLVAEDPSASLLFNSTDLNIVALAAELDFLANPVKHAQATEIGNESLGSLALISARYTHTAIDVLSQLVAAHLIAVCQALDLRAMHVQFWELYQPRFLKLVAEFWGTSEHPSSPSNPTDPSQNLSNLPDLVSSSSPDDPDSTVASDLSTLLWPELLRAFDTTASMDSQERFVAVAKSLRPVLLDQTSFSTSAGFIPKLESFTEALSISLNDVWCSHRDAYLVHGDAIPLLGKASKQMYTFLRHTLKVPMMATRNLAMPKPEEIKDGSGTQAPTNECLP
ncbi:hypothetical protein M426DRAFT_25786 [Hypoxylon sp. CI-4A]|nr:hypothetical protein M426DRAFT_25786 [Hypoxylon sp. CI-4A]